MSKITSVVFCITILGVIAGTYAGVSYLVGGPGALIVVALVYSFVVAKRERDVMSVERALQSEAEAKDSKSEHDVIPDWLERASAAA